jgi:sugar/nucleoside kinase (ribokinase family)
VYFALVASRFAPVSVLGIAGDDTFTEYRQMLQHVRADLSGVVVSSEPTFTWHAVHDFDRWVTSSESSEPGCDPLWRPQLGDAARQAPVLFLASLEPHLQHEVLRQSDARLVGADSMTVFMRRDPESVRAVIAGSDVLFLNRDELRTLTGKGDWRAAARGLLHGGRLRAVVVKAGPLGAALVTRSSLVERPAAAVKRVVDPTGAGDALAGGFLGCCAAAERDDDSIFESALQAGIDAAAAAISAFGPRDLIAEALQRAASAADAAGAASTRDV